MITFITNNVLDSKGYRLRELQTPRLEDKLK